MVCETLSQSLVSHGHRDFQEKLPGRDETGSSKVSSTHSRHYHTVTTVILGDNTFSFTALTESPTMVHIPL